MRLLSDYELDLVAGGTASSDGDQGGGYGYGGGGGGNGGMWAWIPVRTFGQMEGYPPTSGWGGYWAYRAYDYGTTGGWTGGSGSGNNSPAPEDFSDPNNHCDTMDKIAQTWGQVAFAPTQTYGPHAPGVNNVLGAEKMNFYGRDSVGNIQTVGNEYWLVPMISQDGSSVFGFSPQESELPSTMVEGFIHSHPAWTMVANVDSQGHPTPTGEWRENSSNMNLINRYPSPGDWNVLERIHDRNVLLGFPDNNPSMYIMDPSGVVREFKYSDRATFQSMSQEQMISGDGLTNRVVNHCGG